MIKYLKSLGKIDNIYKKDLERAMSSYVSLLPSKYRANVDYSLINVLKGIIHERKGFMRIKESHK